MSTHLAPHLASQLFGVPLLIEQSKLDTILAGLGPRFGVEGKPFDREKAEAEELRRTELLAGMLAGQGVKVVRQDAGHYNAGRVAIVPVMGTLVQRAGWMDSMSGLQSYANVVKMAQSAEDDPSIESVVYEFDTRGGAVAGAFDAADQLFAMRGKGKKPKTVHVNETCASAGYLLAAAAGDEIVMSRTADAGSIGVVTAHIDRSKQMEQAGVAVTFIYAGDKKVDGNSAQPLPPRVKKDVQARIDETYELFVGSVAKYRGMKADDLRATQAGMFGADEAVRLGLADRIESFNTELSNQVFSRTGPRSSGLKTHSQETTMSEAEKPTDTAPKAEVLAAAKAEGSKEGASTERARIEAITGHAEAKGREKLASHLAFKTDMSVEAATALLAASAKEQADGKGSGFDAAMDAAGTPDVKAAGEASKQDAESGWGPTINKFSKGK